jgi:hypothetical protein
MFNEPEAYPTTVSAKYSYKQYIRSNVIYSVAKYYFSLLLVAVNT